MLRWLYIRLLWMHPPRFRSRFCDEMLADFDLSAGQGSWRLLGDAAASVFRQWVLRPGFHEEPVAAPADSAVMFSSLEDYKPRSGVFIYGSVLSVGVFFVVLFALAHSNVGRTFSIGIQRPGLGLIPIDRNAFKESDQAIQVRMGAEPEDPLKGLASMYFKANRVARALDADHDLAISASEILMAQASLSRIDLDHDGALSPEECGFYPDKAGLGAELLDRARATFMRMHPLLAALDADHDGQISAREVQTSAAALQRADRNRDGMLTPIEVLPELAAVQAALIRTRLDTNDDGRISRDEQSVEDTKPVRELLERADRNRDGVVTEAELRGELRRLHENRRQRETAIRSRR